MSKKILIMGAAGRDFHVFNCCYRDKPQFHVVAFTATQIPNIDDRLYPASLAGSLYPGGIPIHPEESLDELVEEHAVDEVVFAYSDVSLDYVDERRQRVQAHNIAFSTFDVDATMLQSSKPVIAITATRTGCGKSQTARRVTQILGQHRVRRVAVRHPMPYGDLEKQAVQRFASLGDLDLHDCTVEEREDYEPHLRNGVVVYAGIDYAAILTQAENEADVIVWDGGNNDTPFYRPDLWIVVTDPHRAGHGPEYFPGKVNFQRAGLILINKIDSADKKDIATIEAHAARLNPKATVAYAESALEIPDPAAISGKRVLVIEDGPTTTHGDMPFGAGAIAAWRNNAAELVDPRPWAVGEIAETFRKYPDTGPLLPAVGYGDKQMRDLEATINAVDCDLVLVATPVDLTRLMNIARPCQRIGYRLAEIGDTLARAVTSVI